MSEQIPGWMKVGAKPLRWAISAENRETLMVWAERVSAKFDIESHWNGRYWIGGTVNVSPVASMD
jgi:hypothetical protein